MDRPRPNSHVFAVIMVGGPGTRLWPASRRARPKPLMEIAGASLFRQAVDRAKAATGDVARIILITVKDAAKAVRAEAPEIPAQNVIVEPVGRDTAACIGLGACVVRARDPDGVMAVLPADHLISPVDAFAETVRRAVRRAGTGALVTLGITPRRPETGYGYIHRGEQIETGVFRVRQFKEKPDIDTAKKYLADGGYYWNSGMFIWRADALLAEMARLLPAHAKAMESIGRAAGTRAFGSVLKAQYEPLQRISIDYGVMEKAKNVEAVEAGFQWDDLGSWTSVAAHLPKDAEGNASARLENLLAIDAKNCVVSADAKKLVALLGVEDLIVVDTKDALFICPRSRDQEVKKVVEELRKMNETDLL
jgi:mannose-1-phosphate guanylyltransferase